MPEKKCRECTMYFEYDSNDIRPFLYHEHPDGTMVANDNPNLIPSKKQYIPSKLKSKQKTIWQDFE